MRYVLGDLEIDEDAYAIRHGMEFLPIEPRAFEVLVYLIQNRDRVVSRSELLQRVWRGYVVGESVVTRCVSIARSAVGDPRCIRTVHGRGYQWMAPVEPAPAAGVLPLVEPIGSPDHTTPAVLATAITTHRSR